MKTFDEATASIPLAWVGPVKTTGPFPYDGPVPLATFESPLWPSVARGAAVTRHAGGIFAAVPDARMTRSVALAAPDAERAAAWAAEVPSLAEELRRATGATSRHAKYLDCRAETAGRLLFLRFAFSTGEASGHNMATKAAAAALQWLLAHWEGAEYVSESGNLCCDKKTSAVNGLLGRGRRAVAEARIPAALVKRFLHVEAADIERLNWRKNYVGSVLAGSLRSANAHFANMLLAFYLATGQDAANIVEGSQGTVLAEAEADGALRFSVTLPNLVVGTVGNGKGLPWVKENLARLGCDGGGDGSASARLAALAAATVLCGELSLLAALAKPGELMGAHLALERGK
ncbi:MAG: hydroxymethylglutaryl-CoA reductase [Kiritimatiellae bacterium]|nr:hydroxymethylglutaryl-CoA reductase [Kiritimatiellia bacterium]